MQDLHRGGDKGSITIFCAVSCLCWPPIDINPYPPNTGWNSGTKVGRIGVYFYMGRWQQHSGAVFTSKHLHLMSTSIWFWIQLFFGASVTKCYTSAGTQDWMKLQNCSLQVGSESYQTKGFPGYCSEGHQWHWAHCNGGTTQVHCQGNSIHRYLQ